VPTFVTDVFWLGLGITVLMWAALATAWNISAGLAGGLSLGHAAYFGVGAYTATLLFLRLGISPWLGMLAAAALAGALGRRSEPSPSGCVGRSSCWRRWRSASSSTSSR
jgi:branched-chain amino acid transport system permease protein